MIMNRTKEERAVLLCLTRLAMFFNTSGHTYSGQQVAEIILTAWHSYEQSKIEGRDRRGTRELASGVTPVSPLAGDQTTIAEQSGQQPVNAGDLRRPSPQESLAFSEEA